MKIHYCDTTYNSSPPTDVNPLLLERYKGQKILVLCAREGMVKRINKTRASVTALGWWELNKTSLFSKGQLQLDEFAKYDVLIVVGKDRIDKALKCLLWELEDSKLFSDKC